MTNKTLQEIIDYLESGDKFIEILIKELDRKGLSDLEKRRYSSLLDALIGPDELYCAMNDWPDNISFKVVSKKENQVDEIILQHGPITIDMVTAVSDLVGKLPLTNEQKDRLIELVCKQLVAVENESFIQGFKVCVDTVHNKGFKGLEDVILKVSRIENSIHNNFVSTVGKEKIAEDTELNKSSELIFNDVYGKDELKTLKDCTVYLVEDVENKEKDFHGTNFVFYNENTGKYISLINDRNGKVSMSQWY